jgi:flagellar assembly protein FliH
MAETGKLRKPQDLTEEEMELVNSWHLPHVEDEEPQKPGKSSAMGRSVDWYYGRKQRELEAELEVEEEIKPLTAEDIEALRQSAYDEGILQGHNDGYETGFAEGLEKGHAQGLTNGHEEGVTTGLEEGQATVEAQAIRWKELAFALNTPLVELNEVVEKQLVELAVQLAEAVIGVEVKTNQSVIFNTLKETVAALPISDSVCQISLNPEDLALVKATYSEQDLADKGWHVKAESAIEQGGCIVESRTSSIDQTLKERVKNTLERFLLDTGINKPDTE